MVAAAFTAAVVSGLLMANAVALVAVPLLTFEIDTPPGARVMVAPPNGVIATVPVPVTIV
jgi:hypothetical protein